MPIETTDAPSGVSTPYSMEVGDTFFGEISFVGDTDWIAAEFQAGQTYIIDILGQTADVGGTLYDTWLALYDASGTFITSDDDSGEGSLDAQITYTATYTGTYYISAESYPDDNEFISTGTYYVELTSPEPSTAPVGTLDELADYLTDGYWDDKGERPHHWVEDADDPTGITEISVDITALSAEGQKLARWAFEAWEMVADINFVEVTSGADITFTDTNNDNVPDYQDSPSSYVDYNIWGANTSATVNIPSDWLGLYGTTIESRSFSTYLHEIGHTLGLGHLGNYGEIGEEEELSYAGDATFANDSYQVSVMSYFSQTDNTWLDASNGEPVIPMLADVVAIQNLYGTPDISSATAGHTVWGAHSNLGNYLDDLFATALYGYRAEGVYDGGNFALTIYDRDGIDRIDLSPLSEDNRVDLRDGEVSDIAGLIGNVGIARDTIIEGLISGSGNDSITGNDANNWIDGQAGNDYINGGIGADTLIGGDGDDVLDGGLSPTDLRDVIYCGIGNDSADGGAGNDELRGDAGNDSLTGGDGADTVLGGGDDDLLTGQAWSDLLFGGEGNDFINGGYGYDRVNGGDGADRFFHLGVGGHGSDWIQDYDAAEGDVLVFGGTASADQFQVNYASTDNAGEADFEEAFVIYRPTQQILWALVDGGGQDSITLVIAGSEFDLLA